MNMGLLGPLLGVLAGGYILGILTARRVLRGSQADFESGSTEHGSERDLELEPTRK